ncbi:MAG: hypothetical protein LUD27_00960, partial [Clostridia bacterium]|nr:hypothetical protein [Clostridia bacterium]
MLGRQETEIMNAVYELCDGADSCLVSGADILSLVPRKSKCNKDTLDELLFALHCDGYFDVITSERKGEKMYVITLKESGFAFKRNEKQRQRDVG